MQLGPSTAASVQGALVTARAASVQTPTMPHIGQSLPDSRPVTDTYMTVTVSHGRTPVSPLNYKSHNLSPTYFMAEVVNARAVGVEGCRSGVQAPGGEVSF